MRHAKPEPSEVGQDSFLDVVANVVGVLIMLVMLVGLRAAHSAIVENPQVAEQPDASQQIAQKDSTELKAEINTTKRKVDGLEKEVLQARSKLVAVGREAAASERRQIELATCRSVIEEDIHQRRERLDSAKQREFDVQRNLFECKLE